MPDGFNKKESILNPDLNLGAGPIKSDPKFHDKTDLHLFSTGIVDSKILDGFDELHDDGSASTIWWLTVSLHALRARLVRGKPIYIYDRRKKSQIEFRYIAEFNAWIEGHYPVCWNDYERSKHLSD